MSGTKIQKKMAKTAIFFVWKTIQGVFLTSVMQNILHIEQIWFHNVTIIGISAKVFVG